MAKLRLAYFGSPDFSARFLEKLIKDKTIPVEVVQVFTQPDKPVGRKGVLTASDVKKTAKKYKVPTLHLINQLKQNIDLALVFAYGEMIPRKTLKIPKYGFWNIHPSLLPLYRGPSPVAQPLIDGATKTGATLMQMDEQMDHGPIIAQVTTEIKPKEKRPELTLRLTDLAFELFKKTINNVILGSQATPESDSGQARMTKNKFHEQDHVKVTYTKLLTKKDGYIEISNIKYQISNSPETLFNRFRGLHPWPGVWTLLRLKASEGQAKTVEKRLKITDMDLVGGKLIIKKVQLEGKNEVPYKTFVRAYNLSLT